MPDRLPKANSQLDKLTDSTLATYGQAIVDGLGSVAGLALFPAPPVLPATLQTLVTSFVNAMAAAADGGKLQTAQKNDAKLALEQAIRADSRYVTQVSQAGSVDYETIRARILVSGFVDSKIPSPVSTLPAPEIDLVQSQAKGQLTIRLISQPGAKGYQMLYRLVGETSFNSIISTSSRWKQDGFLSGQTYQIKFVSIGTRNTVVTESDLVNYVIL